MGEESTSTIIPIPSSMKKFVDTSSTTNNDALSKEVASFLTPEFFKEIQDALNVKYHEVDDDELKDRPGMRSATIQEGTVDGETFMDIHEEYIDDADIRYAPLQVIQEEKKCDTKAELRQRHTVEARKQQEALLGEILALDLLGGVYPENQYNKGLPNMKSKEKKHVSFTRENVTPSGLPEDFQGSSNTNTDGKVKQMLTTIKSPADIYRVMQQFDHLSVHDKSFKSTNESPDLKESPKSTLATGPLFNNDKPLKSIIKSSSTVSTKSHSSISGAETTTLPSNFKAVEAKKTGMQKVQIVKTNVLEKEPPPPPIIPSPDSNPYDDNWVNNALTYEDLIALSKEFQQIPASLAGGIPVSRNKSNHKYVQDNDSDSFEEDDDENEEDDIEDEDYYDGMADRFTRELAEFESEYEDQVVWADNDSEEAGYEPIDWRPASKVPPKLKLSTANNDVHNSSGPSNIHSSISNGSSPSLSCTKGTSTNVSNRTQEVVSESKKPISLFKQQRINRLGS